MLLQCNCSPRSIELQLCILEGVKEAGEEKGTEDRPKAGNMEVTSAIPCNSRYERTSKTVAGG